MFLFFVFFFVVVFFFFFQAEDGIRDFCLSRGLGDVYKRQDEDVTIENLPDVSDINQLIDAIANIGATVNRIDRHTVTINGKTIRTHVVEYEQMRKIRASYYLLGALLGKFNKAEVALPGGCAIGSRPIDLHLKGFRALGADVITDHGMVNAPVSYTHLTLPTNREV